MRTTIVSIGIMTVVLLIGSVGLGDTVELAPVKDNTLYQNGSGSVSNGAGIHLFAGRTDDGLLRRAVMWFDIVGAVPAGATISSVSLKVWVNRAHNVVVSMMLHRLLEDWGEGTSNALLESQSHLDGKGAPATASDATWIHQFFNDEFWTNIGGTYVASASAMIGVGANTAFYTWTSTEGMVSDVQNWLDDPSSNFGWLVRGGESIQESAKRFGSREITVSSFRPLLTIDFSPPPVSGDCDGDGDIDGSDFAAFQGCFSGIGGGVAPGCACSDLDGDFDVDLLDFGIFQAVYTGDSG